MLFSIWGHHGYNKLKEIREKFAVVTFGYGHPISWSLKLRKGIFQEHRTVAIIKKFSLLCKDTTYTYNLSENIQSEQCW